MASESATCRILALPISKPPALTLPRHNLFSTALPTFRNTDLPIHLPVCLLVPLSAVPHSRARLTPLDRVRLATHVARHDQRSRRLRNPSPRALSYKLRYHVMYLLAYLDTPCPLPQYWVINTATKGSSTLRCQDPVTNKIASSGSTHRGPQGPMSVDPLCSGQANQGRGI